jgi:hypothetical protein
MITSLILDNFFILLNNKEEASPLKENFSLIPMLADLWLSPVTDMVIYVPY